jgi:hypothetical protein
MNLTISENAWVKVISFASEISVLRLLCCSSGGQCCFSGRAVAAAGSVFSATVL